MANLAALRAAVFPLSTKNLTGGGLKSNPPAGARDNKIMHSRKASDGLHPHLSARIRYRVSSIRRQLKTGIATIDGYNN